MWYGRGERGAQESDQAPQDGSEGTGDEPAVSAVQK